MITFPRAPAVAIGDKVSSVSRNQLSAAFNERLRSGAGDPLFRIWFKAFNLWRNVRNPDGEAFPANDEFFSHFMHVDPSQGSWPDAEPGVSAGANVTNPMMGFAFGSEALNVFDEAGRLAGDDGLEFETSRPTTPSGIWQLGKQQRGALDLTTGAENAPALAAARAHRNLGVFDERTLRFDGAINRGIATSLYLKKYGGLLPRPEVTGDCGNDTYTFTYTFTPLRAGLPAKSYAIGCGSATRIYIQRDHYLITDGVTTERLEASDYVHGPFNHHPRLEHTNSALLDEAIAEYVASFKGTDAQRARDDGYGIRDVAFDFQRFFSTQYWLAPAQAHTDDGLVPDYPTFRINPGEAPAEVDFSDIVFENKTGFNYIGCLVIGTGVTAPISVEVREGDTVHQTISIPAGDSEFIAWMEVPKNIGTFGMHPVPLLAGGTVTLEAAFLEERKPEICDAYLLLRRATGGSNSGANTSAKSIGDDYFANRCLRTDAEVEPATYASENPVVDSARKMFRDNLRLIKRPELRGYAVENGKSVLWFARKVAVSGELLDVWEGLAPGLDPVASGSLLGGVQYKVTGGSIVHNGALVADGGTFTAAIGVKDFSGTGEVRQVNGILATAPPNGLSNEWLMFVATNVYTDSESSDLKPSNYGDVVVGLHNRCHFFANPLRNDLTEDLMLHVAPGQGTPLNAEAASAFNYWKTTNALNGFPLEIKQRFWKSCPVYQAPYEVESAVMDGGEVKLTFKTRFQKADGAPAGDIARTVSGWDLAAIRAELWRSDENALREYLLSVAGLGQCQAMIGDGGNGTNVTVEYGCQGSCHPRFFFNRLAPKVYEDQGGDNDTQDDLDTRAFAAPLRWMTWQLDAICEGYLDPNVAASYASCPPEYPATYTWENLNMQATAARWVQLQPTTERADRAESFGPMPNTLCYADTFNQISAALNLLTSVPLIVPTNLERRSRTFYSRETSSASPPPGAGCPGGERFEEGYSQAVGAQFNVTEENELSAGRPWTNNLVGVGGGASADGTNQFTELINHTTGIEGLTTDQGAGVLTFCDGNARKTRFLGIMNYDELRFTAAATEQLVSPDMLSNVEPGVPVVMASVRRRDSWYVEDNAAGSYHACGQGFEAITQRGGADGKKLRRVTSDVTECKRVTFDENGLGSMREFLFANSPSQWKKPLPPSAYSTFSPIGDFVCTLGPSSTVQVTLYPIPLLRINFPLT